MTSPQQRDEQTAVVTDDPSTADTPRASRRRRSERPVDGERPVRRSIALVLRLLPVVPFVIAIAYGITTLSDDEGVPASSEVSTLDLSTVSTARLESLLTSLQDDPAAEAEVPSVALLLAERHFGTSAYDRAFELYALVIGHPSTEARQFALSLSRIAWIAWMANGDAERALATLDESLSVDPTNSETYYIKAQVLWCGLGDTETAIELLETVLAARDLTAEVRAQVTSDLAAVRAGETCHVP